MNYNESNVFIEGYKERYYRKTIVSMISTPKKENINKNKFNSKEKSFI